jgi:hypothetical protein
VAAGAVPSRDLLSDRFATIAIYWLPIGILVVSGFFRMSDGWRGVIWAAALAVMGFGCSINALRCGRVHCYATGPFFLIMAAVAVLYALKVVSLGAHGWSTISIVTLAGGIALYYVPEILFGRYRRRPG